MNRWIGQLLTPQVPDLPDIVALPCEGQPFNALDYVDLANALGTTYGGSVARPRLPDLRPARYRIIAKVLE